MSEPSLFYRPLNCSHDWVARIVASGDTVVDATAGNGHDSLFLASLVGPGGRVEIFDIQECALRSTQARLEQHGCMDGRARLHLHSHAGMKEFVETAPKAVMFNLGYLPGGDKSIISRADETLAALRSATGILAPGGVLTVVCYPGHDGGDDEAAAVEEFFAGLPNDCWGVAKVAPLNGRARSPFLIAAFRKPAIS